MTTAERGTPPGSERIASRFFADPLRDYVLRCLGRPVSLLQAGCLAPLRELGIGQLIEGGFVISVTAVDADNGLVRRVLHEACDAYDDVITGDLPGRAIIVDANHLRRHLPANPRTLHRQPR